MQIAKLSFWLLFNTDQNATPIRKIDVIERMNNSEIGNIVFNVALHLGQIHLVNPLLSLFGNLLQVKCSRQFTHLIPLMKL